MIYLFTEIYLQVGQSETLNKHTYTHTYRTPYIFRKHKIYSLSITILPLSLVINTLPFSQHLSKYNLVDNDNTSKLFILCSYTFTLFSSLMTISKVTELHFKIILREIIKNGIAIIIYKS